MGILSKLYRQCRRKLYIFINVVNALVFANYTSYTDYLVSQLFVPRLTDFQ